MDPTSNPVVQPADPTDLASLTQIIHHQQAQHEATAASKEAEQHPTAVLDFEQPSPEQEDIFPGDRGDTEAWWVLYGVFMALFPAFGFMVSIGTLQDYWGTHQLAAYTARDIGWIPSVFVYLSLALGLWVGPLFDRYGPRWFLLFGSILYTVMIFLLAECKHYWQFLLCLGFFGGATGACLTTTGMAVVTHWFKKRRGLAAGIAMIGSSFGGVVVPLLLRATLPKYGYQWSIRVIGFVFLACFIVANILTKPRLPPSVEAKTQRIFSLRLFGDPGFSFLTCTVFGIEIVLFGGLGIIPTYASLNGNYPPQTGFYLIAVLNGCSCFGRLLPGFVSDMVGRFNVFGIMIAMTLVFMLVVWLPFGQDSLAALYIFAALFGFGTGSWMALVPVCIGQLCEAEQFGRYYGTLYFIASLALLVCIPVSGELVEAVGQQTMVGFMCAVLGASLGTFCLSRWACLGWKWSWTAKI